VGVLKFHSGRECERRIQLHGPLASRLDRIHSTVLAELNTSLKKETGSGRRWDDKRGIVLFTKSRTTKLYGRGSPTGQGHGMLMVLECRNCYYRKLRGERKGRIITGGSAGLETSKSLGGGWTVSRIAGYAGSLVWLTSRGDGKKKKEQKFGVGCLVGGGSKGQNKRGGGKRSRLLNDGDKRVMAG